MFSFPDSVDVCKLSSQILCGKTSWKFVGLDVFDFRPTIGIDDVLPWFCRGTLRKWTHHYFWNNVMILLNKINVLKIIIILKQFGRVCFLIDHSLRPPIDFLYSGVRIALWCTSCVSFEHNFAFGWNIYDPDKPPNTWNHKPYFCFLCLSFSRRNCNDL